MQIPSHVPVSLKLRQNMRGKLEVRQGDWKKVLQEAINRGEQFDAVSIDAFPNSANEVNRDASSKEALELGLMALKPGGMLTFYSDSRYIPQRILAVLKEAGIPKSCIHYTVAKFEESAFTNEYHYGDLMSVPCIVKPVETDNLKIKAYEEEYREKEADYLDQYSHEFSSQYKLAA